MLERAADPEEWERFERQLRSTGYCRRPVRLRGRVDAVDVATGEVVRVYSTEREPDGTLLKCCGNRREAVCPSCAETYRGDAFQLVAAGMRGGKGVPEIGRRASDGVPDADGAELRAGALAPRRRRQGAALPAAAQRRASARTACGSSCSEVHDEDDPRLGEPICPDCFDYEHAVLWNALAPELWRRTAIQIPRELARLPASRNEAAATRARVLRQGRRVPAPRRAALPLRPAARRRSARTASSRRRRPSYGASC